MFKFHMEGLEEVTKKLEDLSRRAQELDGRHQVPLTELLTPDFLSRCSRFNSVEEMFCASGFEVNSTDDFKAIPDDEWNEFIKNNTSFRDWEEMLGEAGKRWTVDKLGL